MTSASGYRHARSRDSGGTRAFAERHAARGADGPTGPSGAPVSPHAASVSVATASTTRRPSTGPRSSRRSRAGVNLVDTSTNYTDGGSERLVGRVVGEAIRTGRLAREEIIVVSKIGYVQGQNLALAQEREAAGRPFPEMVHYQPGCWHCVHPEFLEDQLARSLDRLGLETLDVCLLHNPEYFLSDARPVAARGSRRVRDEFYRRLAAAFRFFEERVAAGTLGWYGVSSNTVAHPVDDPEATSLARMLGRGRGGRRPRPPLRRPPAADEPLRAGRRPRIEQSAGRARYGAPQPCWSSPSTEGRRRPGQPAAQRGRGARAWSGWRTSPARPARDVDRQLEIVRGLEAEYRQEIAAHLRVGPDSDKPDSFLRWADQLAGVRERVASVTYWEQIEWQVRGCHGARDPAPSTGASRESSLPGGARGATATCPSSIGSSTRSGRRRAAGARSRAAPSLPPSTRCSRRSAAGHALAEGPLDARQHARHLHGPRRDAPPAYVEDATGILGWPPPRRSAHGLRSAPRPPPARPDGCRRVDAYARQRGGACSRRERTSVAKRVIDSSSYGAGKPASRWR